MKFEAAPQESAPEHEIPKKEAHGEDVEKKDRNLEKISDMNDFFDKMLKEVEGSPEVLDVARKEAIKALIEQVKDAAEQIKYARDVKKMQEIKMMMARSWKELEDFVAGDKKLFDSMQEWGKRFVEEKIAYHEIIGDMKEELIEKVQELQEIWNDTALDLAKIEGLRLWPVGVGGSFTNGSFNELFEKFASDLTDYRGHYFENPNLEFLNSFLKQLNEVIISIEVKLTDQEWVAKRDHEKKEELEKAKVIFNHVKESRTRINKAMRDLNKSFRLMKDVHDFHFIHLLNEHPGIEEPEAQAA